MSAEITILDPKDSYVTIGGLKLGDFFRYPHSSHVYVVTSFDFGGIGGDVSYVRYRKLDDDRACSTDRVKAEVTRLSLVSATFQPEGPR